MDYKEILNKYLKQDEVVVKDVDIKECKICKLLKKRILVGQYQNGNKKWSDENGKLWSGFYCPECNIERSNKTMKKLRNGNK